MGLAKYLKTGEIHINAVKKQIEIPERAFVLPYEKIKPQDWGLVYEKYVGQILESEGFYVTYNGLEHGFFDNGIDLIAGKDNQLIFIQCKFLSGIITKSNIDRMLYKASKILFEQFKEHNKKLVFILVVNRIEANFSKRKPKKFRLNFSNIEKVEFPILQYFLDHNYVQAKVKLECREIEMIK